jgi:small subunit ribosomal protein S24e
MNVNIVSTVDNKLLERREIEAEVSFDAATPKRADLKQAICGKVGANAELMVLRQVSSSFGSKAVKVTAHLYPSKDALMAAEPKFIKIREGLMQKEEKKKKVAKAPAKKT